MKNKAPFVKNIEQLEHRGGKKLSQHGVEFSHKKMQVRKHPTSGFRGKKG